MSAGSLVYAQIGEPERFAAPGYPRGFPWLAFRTSTPGVLAEIALCGKRAASTEVAQLGAWRAIARGTAVVLSPLAPA